jgi:glycosyltransferase involved in cell wall biosynthesis
MSTRRVAFAIPGDITTQTGGYIYDSHLIRGLREQGRDVIVIHLGSSYPDPTSEDATDAAEKLSAVPPDCPLIVDGLAFGALHPAALAAISAPVVALVHHPLAYEGGLDATRREHLLETERANLRQTAHVVVTSPYTAGLLVSDYGVAGEHITIARPGIDQVSHPREPVDPPLILSVGIQLPRKGHDVLLRALATLVHLPWQAVIVGQVLDEAYGAHLVQLRDERGLGARVSLAGQVSDVELAMLYRQASVFALATRFEGYGMVFGEAMAHGLPIVSCNTGAVPDTVASGAGFLVEPDDSDGFASALARLLHDDTLHASMAEESARAGALLDNWSYTAARVGAVLDNVSGRTD